MAFLSILVYTDTAMVILIPTPNQTSARRPPLRSQRLPRKEIPLISVPNDRDMIAAEMAELLMKIGVPSARLI